MNLAGEHQPIPTSPQYALRVTTVRGIPIYLHYSWLLACGLILWSLAETYYPEVSPLRLDRGSSWLMAVGTMPLLFFCIALHELAHATMAQAFGIRVPYIILMLFGGVAQYEREAKTPTEEAWIAAAGPIMSLGLAIGFALLNLSVPAEPVQAVLLLLKITNTGIAAFNLFPCFPMDGGRLCHALIWRLTGQAATATRLASTLGQLLSSGLIALGFFLWLTLTAPAGVWLAFLGVFLYKAATDARQGQHAQ